MSAGVCAALILAWITVCSCSGGGGESKSGWSDAAKELGITERLDRATDPGASACSRADSLAGSIVGDLEEADQISPGFSESFKEAFNPWVDLFGPFHGMIYGEIRRIREYFSSDQEINLAELDFLNVALSQHARYAGVSKESRNKLINAINQFGIDHAERQAMDLMADIQENTGHIFSALQLCSPK